MHTIARILIAALLLPYFLVPIQTVSAIPAFQFDGTFEQSVIQTNASARTETKAAFGITIGDASQGILFGSHWFYLDGTRILFSPGGNNTVSPSTVSVQTTTNQATTAAAELVALAPTFTSANGNNYTITNVGAAIRFETTGAETREGTNIPTSNFVINSVGGSMYNVAGFSARAARPEIVDFTPLNPRTGEIFTLLLDDKEYTATGTTVAEIISGILAAMVADPSPLGNCVDMTTKIRCTSIDHDTSLNSYSVVSYLNPDTTAPIVALVGSGAITLNVGDAYTELGATWMDARDGTGTVTLPYTGSVNTSQPGIYTLSYRFVDFATNTSNIVTRAVTVIDVTPPVVTVLGSGAITHELDIPYVDSGATWTDDIDGSGTVTASGISAMTATGLYTLTYTQTDAGGNIGTGSREVTIVDNIAPVVTITTSPASVNANSYKITGTAPGASSISITGGSSSVSTTPVNGAFAAFVPLNQDALNTLVVTATDASGNVGTGSVVVTETSSGNLFVSAIPVSGSTFSGATTFSGGSFSTTTQVTVQSPVTFVSSSGASSVIPSGTIITSASGGSTFDASSINVLSITVTGGLLSNETPKSALEFGTFGSGLHFSRPIMIQIPVTGYTGTTIPVKVKHGGTSTFVTTGLTNNSNSTCTNGVSSSPSATATVTGGLATIYTCAASTFVTYTESVVVNNNSSSGGGGGGSYIPAATTVTAPIPSVIPTLSVTGSMSFVVDLKSFRSSKIIKTITTEKNGTRIFVSRILPNGKSRIIGTTRVLRGEIRYRIPVQGKYKFTLTK